MTVILRALVALCLLVPAAAVAQAPGPLTARILETLDRVGSPAVSPDGRLVAYDLRSVDLAANSSVHAVWIVDLTRPGAEARPLERAPADSTRPAWAPDGRGVYVVSGRSGTDQVWRLGVDGGRAVQVTHLPLDVGAFRVSPDGRRLVVALSVYPDAESPAATHARLEADKTRGTSGVVYDHLFVRHWDSWADGRRNHLFAVELGADGVQAGDPTPLMAGFDGDSPSKPFGGAADFDIAPDGQSVVFSARVAGRDEPWSTHFDLWRAPIGGGPLTDLTAGNTAWSATPVFSPDGGRLAWRAQTRRGAESDCFGVWILDLRTGGRREAAPGWDRSAASLAWSPDGRALLVTAEDVGRVRLFAIDAATGAVAGLTERGSVEAVSVGGPAVVFQANALDSPDQLFLLGQAGPARQLTRAGAAQLAGVGFSPDEPFTFAGWNGETVHGYVVKPFGWRPGETYPVVYLIHGGPEGSFGDGWSYRWNPQVWAGWGYGVVMVDFHGSAGYGQAFTDSIVRHWGDRPLEDLQKGWTAALAQFPWLDGHRACAAGASYGGYMIYWMAGLWNSPWRCLIDHDGVFDTRMMGYSTEELWFSEWENGGTPWDEPAAFERFNPALHVAEWVKPMLVVHSGRDYRIPLEQGLAAFT
ncbi:MAG: S9 family peptidase, partial [Caulobacteraceae bacterium]|nr:S9 family peptidase [Caulobacteraceae bacterium]